MDQLKQPKLNTSQMLTGGITFNKADKNPLKAIQRTKEYKPVS